MVSVRPSPLLRRSQLLACLCLWSALLAASLAGAQHTALQPPSSSEHGVHHSQHHEQAASSIRWEGSPAGKAYSEFNHHLAGLFVLLIGAVELAQARGRCGAASGVGRAASYLLPLSMLASGVFLMIWSDHEAWPIGPLSLRETFSGQDLEMLQHKLFGILLLAIGTIEALRRCGTLRHPAWRVPLPTFAIVGGVSLFLHSHGAHPEAHKIALHHAVMGAMAVTAGSTKLAAQWRQRGKAAGQPSRWELLWATLVLLIGVQLLVYTE